MVAYDPFRVRFGFYSICNGSSYHHSDNAQLQNTWNAKGRDSGTKFEDFELEDWSDYDGMSSHGLFEEQS